MKLDTQHKGIMGDQQKPEDQEGFYPQRWFYFVDIQYIIKKSKRRLFISA
jgi:hypothetical protein